MTIAYDVPKPNMETEPAAARPGWKVVDAQVTAELALENENEVPGPKVVAYRYSGKPRIPN